MVEIIDLPHDKIVVAFYPYTMSVKSGKKIYHYKMVSVRITYNYRQFRFAFRYGKLHSFIVNAKFKFKTELVEGKYMVIEPKYLEEFARFVDRFMGGNGRYARKMRRVFA